jgi:beta-lactamase class A
MRKLFAILVYTFVILLIGRNFTALPRFGLFSTKESYTTDLKKQTQQLLTKEKGNYGVYFYNIGDHTSFGINEEMTFTAASVNKVPIVAALYALNKQGKIDLDEEITLQKEDIQDYGTGSLRYQKPGSVYSLRTLAKLSLQQSDNTAAHILGKRIGTPLIQRMVDNWGMTQTNIEDNKTSPKDMGILFLKLYRGEITSLALTKEIFGFMKDTDVEDRLPRLLPSDALIYHKTGDAIGSLHDVGIIQRGTLTFFVGVLTSDIGENEAGAKTKIAEIAKTILTFYANRD